MKYIEITTFKEITRYYGFKKKIIRGLNMFIYYGGFRDVIPIINIKSFFIKNCIG